MGYLGVEKRTYERFDKQEKAFLYFSYDLATKMDLIKEGQSGETPDNQKFPAFSKDVSAEGLCFTSFKKCGAGDKIQLDMYIGESTRPLHMAGEVCWSRATHPGIEEGGDALFDTGIRLVSIDGREVADSIYYDETYHVIWSEVLEKILGRVKQYAQQKTA